MSNLPGNPHEGLAKTWLVAVSGDDADSTNQIFAQCASAEATLALAYEQRTANLIALLDTPAGRLALAGHETPQRIESIIRELLGLEDK